MDRKEMDEPKPSCSYWNTTETWLVPISQSAYHMNNNLGHLMKAVIPAPQKQDPPLDRLLFEFPEDTKCFGSVARLQSPNVMDEKEIQKIEVPKGLMEYRVDLAKKKEEERIYLTDCSDDDEGKAPPKKKMRKLTPAKKEEDSNPIMKRKRKWVKDYLDEVDFETLPEKMEKLTLPCGCSQTPIPEEWKQMEQEPHDDGEDEYAEGMKLFD